MFNSASDLELQQRIHQATLSARLNIQEAKELRAKAVATREMLLIAKEKTQGAGTLAILPYCHTAILPYCHTAIRIILLNANLEQI